MKGQKDPLTGTDAYGFLDPLKFQWGGFGYYFIADRAAAYGKHPSDKAWLFDPDTMKPRVNNPAWVKAIQDVMDLMAAGAYPADQVNTDPNGTAFTQFLGGTGSMLTWWGDVGSNVRTNDSSIVGEVTGFSINPGADEVYNSATGAVGEAADGPNFAPNMAYIGWGVYVTSRVSRRREEAKGGVDPRRRISAARTCRCGWRPIRPASSPTATRTSTYEEWEEAGYDGAFVEDYLGSNANSYNHPNAAIEPRIPGIFQYYSILEDELVKGFNGQYGSAQETADAIAAAWEKITDQIGRDNQIKLYKASLGM